MTTSTYEFLNMTVTEVEDGEFNVTIDKYQDGDYVYTATFFNVTANEVESMENNTNRDWVDEINNNGASISTDLSKDNSHRFLVVQRVDGHDEYVWDEEAENTAVDCPNGAADYLTRREAEELLSALESNARLKGWDNAEYFIEEVEA